MFLEYMENIVQLLCILIALLMSLFQYINTRKRGWLYSVIYFISNLLSCYFWTAYLVIMGETANTTSGLANFGWNVGYFVMMTLPMNIKTREERRYFHPLMLLPIPINALQLKLYMNFSGKLMSLFQVTTCTIVACFAIQSIVWYLKRRDPHQRTTNIAPVLLLLVASEFGMWTSSCFDGWIGKLYYLSSLICSLGYLALVWAIRKTYEGESVDTSAAFDKRLQNVLKISYLATVAICSLGGIALGGWMRDKLSGGVTDGEDAGVYDIIPTILFLISLILVAFAIVIVFIVYFEQKMFENARLRQEKRVAEQSNTAKSEFLANMSHEIRTPINAVLGMNRMVMRESIRARDFLPEEREDIRKVFEDITGYSGNIDSAGKNLLSIINDILDLSKIEAGKLEITEKDYMLSSVLNDVSNTVLFKAKEKGLSFHAQIDRELPDGLFGDDVRIRQVMTNLLNNAVKYTDRGSITLSVRGQHDLAAGDILELVITVTDTGIGIEKNDLDKIFGKFERTDLKRNSTVEGTGLGLAITDHIVGLMKGSISVESEYGKGSVFTVRIPQRIVSVEPIGDFHEKFRRSLDESTAGEVFFRAPDARILIVDDTRMNLMVAVGLLKDTEMTAETAESGKEALELTQNRQYDLILMDQRMPGMDGTETLRHLREQESAAGGHSRTPVICLTADAISGAKERYLAQGFDDYLSKPIDSRALKRMLMQYLPEEKVIIPETADRTETTETSGGDQLYAALREAGVDTEKGLGYCQNSDKLYRTMLGEYLQSGADKLKGIQRFFEEQDDRNYSIIVHSLKSTSRTIGAEEIAELSAELERAADAGDRQAIADSHFKLMSKYEDLIRLLSHELENEGQLTGEDDDILEFFPDDGE